MSHNLLGLTRDIMPYAEAVAFVLASFELVWRWMFDREIDLVDQAERGESPVDSDDELASSYADVLRRVRDRQLRPWVSIKNARGLTAIFLCHGNMNITATEQPPVDPSAA